MTLDRFYGLDDQFKFEREESRTPIDSETRKRWRELGYYKKTPETDSLGNRPYEQKQLKDPLFLSIRRVARKRFRLGDVKRRQGMWNWREIGFEEQRIKTRYQTWNQRVQDQVFGDSDTYGRIGCWEWREVENEAWIKILKMPAGQDHGFYTRSVSRHFTDAFRRMVARKTWINKHIKKIDWCTGQSYQSPPGADLEVWRMILSDIRLKRKPKPIRPMPWPGVAKRLKAQSGTWSWSRIFERVAEFPGVLVQKYVGQGLLTRYSPRSKGEPGLDGRTWPREWPLENLSAQWLEDLEAGRLRCWPGYCEFNPIHNSDYRRSPRVFLKRAGGFALIIYEGELLEDLKCQDPVKLDDPEDY
jgi:hypothetical protein